MRRPLSQWQIGDDRTLPPGTAATTTGRCGEHLQTDEEAAPTNSDRMDRLEAYPTLTTSAGRVQPFRNARYWRGDCPINLRNMREK